MTQPDFIDSFIDFDIDPVSDAPWPMPQSREPAPTLWERLVSWVKGGEPV